MSRSVTKTRHVDTGLPAGPRPRSFCFVWQCRCFALLPLEYLIFPWSSSGNGATCQCGRHPSTLDVNTSVSVIFHNHVRCALRSLPKHDSHRSHQGKCVPRYVHTAWVLCVYFQSVVWLKVCPFLCMTCSGGTRSLSSTVQSITGLQWTSHQADPCFDFLCPSGLLLQQWWRLVRWHVQCH